MPCSQPNTTTDFFQSYLSRNQRRSTPKSAVLPTEKLNQGDALPVPSLTFVFYGMINQTAWLVANIMIRASLVTPEKRVLVFESESEERFSLVGSDDALQHPHSHSLHKPYQLTLSSSRYDSSSANSSGLPRKQGNFCSSSDASTANKLTVPFVERPPALSQITATGDIL